MSAISNREFAKIIKKLRISDNSVVVVESTSKLGEDKMIEAFAKALQETRLKNVVLVSVDDLTKITTLSETEMARYGWYRKETLSKLLSLDKRTKLYSKADSEKEESDLES